MPVDLSGKRMIVTGGATGIGRAVAIRSAVYGAQVAVMDVNDADGQETISDISESGGEARYWHVDVREGQDVAKVVSEANDWMGGVDVLVHLAGVLQAHPSSWTNFLRRPGTRCWTSTCAARFRSQNTSLRS